jgi:hypothetical protein
LDLGLDVSSIQLRHWTRGLDISSPPVAHVDAHSRPPQLLANTPGNGDIIATPAHSKPRLGRPANAAVVEAYLPQLPSSAHRLKAPLRTSPPFPCRKNQRAQTPTHCPYRAGVRLAIPICTVSTTMGAYFGFGSDIRTPPVFLVRRLPLSLLDHMPPDPMPSTNLLAAFRLLRVCISESLRVFPPLTHCHPEAQLPSTLGSPRLSRSLEAKG